MTEPAPTESRSPIDFVLAGYLAVLAMVTGVVSVFFLPWRVGATAVPISALIGAAVLFWTIRAGYRLTGSMVVAFLPALLWLGSCAWLTTSATLGFGLVIGDWRAMMLLGLGVLAAAAALGAAWGTHLTGRVQAAR